MGTLLSNPSNVPVSVSADWEPLVNINAAGNVGYNAISLTNWDASTLAPAIAAGSMIEINGSIAYFQNQEAIGGIATGVNYLRFTVSGTTVTPVWSLTGPTWSAGHNAWMDGGIRYTGHACYQSGGAYTEKHIIKNSEFSWKEIAGTATGSTNNIPHHLSDALNRIRTFHAAITNDGLYWYDIANSGSDITITPTDVQLTALAAGWLYRIQLGYLF